MNRVLACTHFIFLLLVGACQAAEVEAGLFTPRGGPSQLDTRPVNPAIVLRQRLVFVQLELLPRMAGQEVILNLFDNVVLRVALDHMESNASGEVVWIGHTQDVAGGAATFAITAQGLAGTVETPTLLYHIRPYQDQLYVIREIRPPVLRSAQSAVEGTPSSMELEVVDLVNLEREIEYLPPLVWDNALGAAALGHSTDMAQMNYFSHTSLDGRLFDQRITGAGYSYNTCGENIAAGYSTPQAVMNGWMSSPGHRANILHSSFCDIGVGYAFASGSNYGHYWTQDFGRREGVTACPPAEVEYTITATAGPHGTIDPSGSVKVPSGKDQTFHIRSDAGYRILDVKIDGVSKGAVASHTFKSVFGDHSIEATFKEGHKGAGFMPWMPLLPLDE